MRFVLCCLVFLSHAIASAESARVITDSGTIVFKLLSTEAPKTVDNFKRLAKGEQKYIGTDGKKSNKPFYDGLLIHRVHPELGFFTGCPWGTGRGWPGYYMFDEAPAASKFDRPGLVAMAKVLGDNRVGSQLFITNRDLPRLNGKYTVFGEVTEGMDVVTKIASATRDSTMKPRTPIRIKSVEFIP